VIAALEGYGWEGGHELAGLEVSPVRVGLAVEPKEVYLAREARARLKIDEQLAAAPGGRRRRGA